ncbi:hypothetical protein GCM10020000_61390 [Streptomyces olivoverticillatus]
MHVSTKLNRSHVITGAHALILPTLGRTERDRQHTGEQFVTVEDSMGMVHASRGRLAPPQAPPPALRTGHRLPPRPPRPRPHQHHPVGRLRERLRRHPRPHLPRRPRLPRLQHPCGPPRRLHPPPRPPATTAPSPPPPARPTSPPPPRRIPHRPPEGRLLLQTLRSHDQYNTTIYGLDDRYRGIKNGRRVVLVHPDDATALGLPDGTYADLVSEWTDGSERRAPGFRVVHYPTARGCAAAYYPETNVLVPPWTTPPTPATPRPANLSSSASNPSRPPA